MNGIDPRRGPSRTAHRALVLTLSLVLTACAPEESGVEAIASGPTNAAATLDTDANLPVLANASFAGSASTDAPPPLPAPAALPASPDATADGAPATPRLRTDGSLLFSQVADRALLWLDVGAATLRRTALAPDFAAVWPRSTGRYHTGLQPVSGSVIAQTGRCIASESRGLAPCGLVFGGGRATASFLFGGEVLAAPRVSFDGRLIAIRLRYDATESIQLFNAAGRNLGRYPSDARDVRWSGDNRLILLSADGRTLRVSQPVPVNTELAGLQVVRRITLNADDGGRAYAMDLAPDGASLAYTWVVNAGGTTRRGEVRTLDLGTLRMRRIASTPNFVAGDLVSGLLRVYNLWTVGWSPDGRALFVGIGGGNRTVGPAGSGALLQMSATRTGTMRIDTADRDLRDGLQYPAYTDLGPMRHGGYPGASDDVLDLAAGAWPYTDYQWVNW